MKCAERFDLLVDPRVVAVSYQPLREPAFAAEFVADASQLAMAYVCLKASPEPVQIPFVALVAGEEMTSGEHQHPRNVAALVVVSCGCDDFVEARGGE